MILIVNTNYIIFFTYLLVGIRRELFHIIPLSATVLTVKAIVHQFSLFLAEINRIITILKNWKTFKIYVYIRI